MFLQVNPVKPTKGNEHCEKKQQDGMIESQVVFEHFSWLGGGWYENHWLGDSAARRLLLKKRYNAKHNFNQS